MAEAMPLDAVLLVSTGLVISLGHCVGMCGPLLGAYSMSQREPGRSAWRLLPALLVYHAGRLTGYAIIGLGFGLLGSATRLAGQGRIIQGVLSLVVGVLMGLLGAGLLGWLPTQRWVESSRLGQGLAGRLRGLLSSRSVGGRALLGLGNGFLPCGPVYAVAIGTMAAAGPWLGAGAMLLFGAGTLPVLLALGLGAGGLAPLARRRFNRLGAILVIVIGLQLLLRGAAAFGWVPHLKFGEVVIW
jgi:sulfite exporter TauE/SafE